jgi:hypothetical protein
VPGPESLIPFAAFWLVAVLTPGPNMLLFTWLAVSKPSRIALSCVAGIQSAMLIRALSGLFGLAEIHPGDVVWFPPGEKHWHGATATTAMTHIAIAEALEGKSVDWVEKVSDNQYRR